jgi:hypothetical protein
MEVVVDVGIVFVTVVVKTEITGDGVTFTPMQEQAEA